MTVQLNPQLQKFIDDQVRAGHFPSADAAVEAAIEQMKLDQAHFELTEAELNAIEESEAQIDRGEYAEFDAFAAEMPKKFCRE